MDMVPWRPWRELEHLRNSLDRFFAEPLFQVGNLGNLVGGALTARLPVEVLERGGEVILRAELPGIEAKDVEIRITDEGVSLRGERRLEADQDREGIRHTERYYGSFVRSVAFPVPVDSAQARASFKNGVLEIRAPRRQPGEGRDGRRLDISTH